MSDPREVTTNGQNPVIALNGQCLSIRIDDVRLKGPCCTAWSVGGSSIDGSDRFKSTANYKDENICDYILLEIKKVTSSDCGRYECLIKNNDCKIKREVEITPELLQNLVKKEDTENGVVKKKSKKSHKKSDGHVEEKSPSEIDDRLEKKTRRPKRRSIEKLPVIDLEENKSLQKINGSLLPPSISVDNNEEEDDDVILLPAVTVKPSSVGDATSDKKNKELRKRPGLFDNTRRLSNEKHFSGHNSNRYDETISEEEDMVPDLPIYDGNHINKMSGRSSSAERHDSCGEESPSDGSVTPDNPTPSTNGWHRLHVDNAHCNGSRDHTPQDRVDSEFFTNETNGLSPDTVRTVRQRETRTRRRGVCVEPDLAENGTSDGHDVSPQPPPPASRNRRMSAVDLSRSAHQRLLRMSSSSSYGGEGSSSAFVDQVYSNPEMEIFRQRRLSQHMVKRVSLADIIPDWPTLDYIEKPEYRMPEVDSHCSLDECYELHRRKFDVEELEAQQTERRRNSVATRRLSLADMIPDWPQLHKPKPQDKFKEDPAAEAQCLELKKMDPTAIYKMLAM